MEHKGSGAAALVPRTAGRAFAWYVLITVVMTWPLASVLTTTLPGDLGDPVLNCWILGWNAHNFLALVGGDWSTLDRLWHGNIFYPERYTLGYSELLAAQSIEILPVYAATKNLVLCYNLLFLSTFFLSALGMFLLVRELTGDWRAGFVAGLLFGFVPYRAHQTPHLQVMSSQWMPFVLYGFHRAIATRRLRPLAGGALALVAQNLSCGYFLVFFSLFVPAIVLFDMVRCDRVRDVKLWTAFAVAAAFVAAATVPFMQPYFALRDLHGTSRHVDELRVFSADTWSWLTAQPETTLWSRWFVLLDRPEGALFPGLSMIGCVLIAVIGGVRRAWRATNGTSAPPVPRRPVSKVMGALAVALVAWGLLTLVTIVTGWGGLFRVAGTRIRIQSLSRSLELLGVGVGLALIVLPRARALMRRAIDSPLAIATTCALLAMYLSLGPEPQAAREALNGPPLYSWLFAHMPGFDGLRVPARFAGVALVFLSAVAGWGVRDVLRRVPRHATALMVVMSAAWLIESAILPFPLALTNAADTRTLRAPPASLPVGDDTPPIYEMVRNLPAGSVLLELPIGDSSWEVQYLYTSTMHWRPLVNGYSGYAPESYLKAVEVLREPARNPDLAWSRLIDLGVTHVIVHGEAYGSEGSPRPDPWLRSQNAVEIGSRDQTTIYRLPR